MLAREEIIKNTMLVVHVHWQEISWRQNALFSSPDRPRSMTSQFRGPDVPFLGLQPKN